MTRTYLIAVAVMVAIAILTHFASQKVTVTPESPERLARIEAMAQTGPREPNYFQVFDARSPLENMARTGTGADARAEGGLPASADGTGEFVEGFCGGCHSVEIIKQQRVSRERWDKLLQWMVEEQGMPKLGNDEEAKVLDYLAEHFGTGTNSEASAR